MPRSQIIVLDMSKASRNIGSTRIELHRTDRAASRTRAGDKSHLFIDQTRTRSINYFNYHLIKNLSNLTIKSLTTPTKTQ
jgi:hypothetical protein